MTDRKPPELPRFLNPITIYILVILYTFLSFLKAER